MSKNYLDAFPPPKFLNIPYAGLSISDSAVRCIMFSKKGNHLEIKKYTEKKLSPGIINSGEIVNMDELVKTIESIKNELDLDYVKVSLPEEKGYLFTAKIPLVPPSEVKGAVEAKMEENVPVSPAELIFDYQLKENKEKERLDIVVSALPINVVDKYVELAEKSGLKMISLEIEPQAVARALIKPNNMDTNLIVQFGSDKVSLYVVSERLVHFTSTVTLRGGNADGLDILSQEIKRLFTYWHTLKENVDKEDRKISEIIMCGEKISDSAVSYLSSHTQTKVSLGNVWSNVLNIEDDVPEIDFNDSLKFVAAIGLALPSKVLI